MSKQRLSLHIACTYDCIWLKRERHKLAQFSQKDTKEDRHKHIWTLQPMPPLPLIHQKPEKCPFCFSPLSYLCVIYLSWDFFLCLSVFISYCSVKCFNTIHLWWWKLPSHFLKCGSVWQHCKYSHEAVLPSKGVGKKLQSKQSHEITTQDPVIFVLLEWAENTETTDL